MNKGKNGVQKRSETQVAKLQEKFDIHIQEEEQNPPQKDEEQKRLNKLQNKYHNFQMNNLGGYEKLYPLQDIEL